MYKMLVVDIDDTLVTSTNEITPATMAAVQAMQEAGHYFVLASGRPTGSVLKIAKALNLEKFPTYIISFNGAVVMNLQTKEIIFNQAIESQDLQPIVNFLQENKLAVLTYDESHIVIDRPYEYTHVEEELTGIPTRYDVDFFTEGLRDLPKFIGVGDPAVVQELEQKYQGKLASSSRMVSSKPFYLEIMNEKVSKGDSIVYLAEKLNISMEQVIAMGDGNNDYQMLEVAGLGVAVANASDRLLEIADEVAPSNDQEGVAHIIHKYFLD